MEGRENLVEGQRIEHIHTDDFQSKFGTHNQNTHAHIGDVYTVPFTHDVDIVTDESQVIFIHSILLFH